MCCVYSVTIRYNQVSCSLKKQKSIELLYIYNTGASNMKMSGVLYYIYIQVDRVCTSAMLQLIVHMPTMQDQIIVKWKSAI